MSPIRVLLADDHTVLRDSLKAFLALFPDLEVVGEAADGITTLNLARQLHPDVVLLDLAMPGVSGLNVLRRLTKDLPHCRVVVLTQYETPEYLLQALQEGARGYVLKRASGQEVVQAIRAVVQGGSYLHSAVAPYVIEAATHSKRARCSEAHRPHLTEREKDVLALIGEGKTNAEIASLLAISPKTVDKHRANLMRKLGVNSRAELIRYALTQK